jgi:hypothetical protein
MMISRGKVRANMRSSLSCILLVTLASAAHGGELDGAFLRGSNILDPAGPVTAYAGEPMAIAWGQPAVPEFKIETGARFWVSSGSFAKNLFDDPRSSSNLNSRLTYSGLDGRSGEVFFRIDHASGFFAKGYGGLGTIGSGTLRDEDFPPLIQYSNTTSNQHGGHLGYVNFDYGYNFWTGPGYRLSVFAGYHYFGESVNAFGCTQTAGNPVICIPPIANSTLVITESAAWHSLRLGFAADVLLFDCLRFNVDVAWVPYAQLRSADTHVQRADIFAGVQERATGNGVQLEASAMYQFTNAFSFGVGARYWRLQAKGAAALEEAELFFAPLGQPTTFTTDRFGVYALAAYKFGWN